MALIINADDLGLSKDVNSAICEAFSRGLIDRTTMIVNADFAEEAIKIAKSNGFGNKVGLHLNLTSGKPLTKDISKDRIMCDEAGEFTAEFARHLKTRFFLPKATRQCVRKELKAQLDRYKALSGTLWHIDSHHHVHTDPSVWRILKKELKNYPVDSVRLGRNMYHGGNPLMRLYKVLLNRSINRFNSMPKKYFGSMNDYVSFTHGARKMPENAETEIMVHPVHDENGRLCDISGGVYSELIRP